MTQDKILHWIIEKGGLPGACANIWKNDRVKAGRFIRECHLASHTPTAKVLWGADLIESISNYVNKSYSLKENRLTELDLKIAKTVRRLRMNGGFKQSAIAMALCVSQGYYSKMEKGIKPISIGQLDIMYPSGQPRVDSKQRIS